MPKLKSHSGAKDRIKVTKNGKVLRRHPSSNHMLEKKSAARKRRYDGYNQLDGKAAKSAKLKLGVS